VGVDGAGSEPGDDLAFSFQGEGVVALGGADGHVVHQFAQDVEGDSGVGAALCVGVAAGVGVGVDEGAVEGQRVAVSVGAFAVQVGDAVGPVAQGLAEVLNLNV
jgi:hypothetical protein